MPLYINNNKQEMCFDGETPISKIYFGTILVFAASGELNYGGLGLDQMGGATLGLSNAERTAPTGFCPLGGMGIDTMGGCEIGFSYSDHYDADDFAS